MISRLLASIGVAAAIALVSTLPVAGQAPQGHGSSAATTPALVVTAHNGGPIPASWTSPKTPWGEPDLQGVWSSDDASFGVSRGGGRGGGPAPTGLYLNDEQYAARVKQIQQGVVNAEQNATSTFRNDFARRAFRQTSYIVDPPTAGSRSRRPKHASAPRRVTAARSATARFTPSTTSPITIAASRAESGDRSSA